MAHGGDGVISVISNVVPALMAALCSAMARGDLPEARRLDARLAPVAHAAFIESNPIPIKAMLAMMGRLHDRLRLPLVSMLEAHHPTVRAALVQAGALAS
jgi:4-hydroxy-tetrahydrodipicolinate synthase